MDEKSINKNEIVGGLSKVEDGIDSSVSVGCDVLSVNDEKEYDGEYH